MNLSMWLMNKKMGIKENWPKISEDEINDYINSCIRD